MSGQGYDVVVLSFRLNSREPLPQLLARVLDVSLAEAKSYAKGFPFLVRQGITKEAAEVVRQALEAAGARVSVEPHRPRTPSSTKRVADDTKTPPPGAEAVPNFTPSPVALGAVAVVSKRVAAPAVRGAVEIPQPSGIATLKIGSDVADAIAVQLRASQQRVDPPRAAGPVTVSTRPSSDSAAAAADSPRRTAPGTPTQPLAKLPAFADDDASNDNGLFAAVPDITSGFALPESEEPSAEPRVIVAQPDPLEEPDAEGGSGLELDLSKVDPTKPPPKPRSIKRTGPLPQAQPASPAADSTSDAAQAHDQETRTPPARPHGWASEAATVTAPKALPMRFDVRNEAPEPAEPLPWPALAGLAFGALVVIWFLLR